MKKYNFSHKGWLMIFISFFLYLLTAACTSDGENVILPKLAAANGWDYTQVLSLATAAGCLSVIGNLFLGKICEKKGPKFSIILGLLTSACFVFLYGSASNLMVYAIGIFGAICCAQSISFFGASALIANWFPKKKGLAMGIVTIGPPIATITMVSVMNSLLGALGLKKGVLVISAVLVIVAIICFIFVHDTPEECGETPDNMSQKELTAFHSKEEHTEKLPLGQLLKKKAFWYILIMMGICNLTQTGLMAQFLVRYQGTGISENTVVIMMSIMAFIGIFGSMIVGFFENKLGTQKAYSIFAALFALAFLLNFTDVPVLVYLSIPLFGIVLTLMQIFLSAFELSVFGRKNFKQANAVLFPMISMIGQLSFLLISACLKLFGEVRYAYLIFAILLFVTLILNKLLSTEIVKNET